MLKTSLSRRFYQDFLDSYQSLDQSTTPIPSENAFVYVDHDGIMYLSDLVDQERGEGVFAVSVDGSGYLQLLSTEE